MSVVRRSYDNEADLKILKVFKEYTNIEVNSQYLFFNANKTFKLILSINYKVKVKKIEVTF